MNIFVTSVCPEESAGNLDTKRVIKMILESAQIMSTVHHIKGTHVKGMYKPTHINHPCTKWAAASQANYYWLYRHFNALCKEYTLRRGRTHKTESLKDLLAPKHSISAEPTEFCDCSGQAENLPVTIKYQLCLIRKWSNDKLEPTWE